MTAGHEGPWHSVNSNIYHDNPDCQTGSSIAPENVRPGTGGNRLCEECARLDRAAGLVGDLSGSPEGGRGEEDLLRPEAPRSRAAGAAYDPLAEPRVRRTGEPRVERLSEDAVRSAARLGTREAIDEKEQEQSGGGGLYGSQIDASHLVGAAIAELVGTFILVFGGQVPLELHPRIHRRAAPWGRARGAGHLVDLRGGRC